MHASQPRSDASTHDQGLAVPFNWDGAVELNLAEIFEMDGNAVSSSKAVHDATELALRAGRDAAMSVSKAVCSSAASASRAVGEGIASHVTEKMYRCLDVWMCEDMFGFLDVWMCEYMHECHRNPDPRQKFLKL